MQTLCENITFKLNSTEITLSVDVTSEIYQALKDDEGAVEYIKQLIDSGDIDLGTELKTVQRKDNGSYTLLYDKNTNILQDLDCNAIAGPSSKSTADVKKYGKWTVNITKLLLITERLDKDKIFAHPTGRKSKLWDAIAITLSEKSGVIFTGTECNNKYRNLLQTYRTNKYKTSQTGESSVTWEFYEMFDTFLGTKAPPSETVGSSLDMENEEMSVNSPDNDLPEATPKKRRLNDEMLSSRKPKKNEEISMGHYLFF